MIFDDIRPYMDHEVPTIVKRLLASDKFRYALGKMIPNVNIEDLERIMLQATSVREFKKSFSYAAVTAVSKTTTFSLTLSGRSRIPENDAYVYISNHRDIVLDSAFLNVLLADTDYKMPQVAIGDNLLVRPWIEDFVRLNGSFIVRRGVNLRELAAASNLLSSYMRHTITETKDSIWIAQREGRAKDADDRTQSSVLKMLAMSGKDTDLENLLTLNIVPVSLSYEYDPCDFLKAREILRKRQDPAYKKPEGEDLLNMQTGIIGYKGRVHFTIGTPLRELVKNLDLSHLNKAQLFSEISRIIDKEIHRRYRLYPGNYVAWDLLEGTNHSGTYYSPKEKQIFVDYVTKQVAKIEMKNKDSDELTRLILTMYANQAKAFYAAQSS